jgi:hypothetical protein
MHAKQTCPTARATVVILVALLAGIVISACGGVASGRVTAPRASGIARWSKFHPGPSAPRFGGTTPRPNARPGGRWAAVATDAGRTRRAVRLQRTPLPQPGRGGAVHSPLTGRRVWKRDGLRVRACHGPRRGRARRGRNRPSPCRRNGGDLPATRTSGSGAAVAAQEDPACRTRRGRGRPATRARHAACGRLAWAI